MLYNVKEETVRIGGMEMDYVSFGKGTKPLILIPGLSFKRVRGAGIPLAIMYRLFADEYKVYIFDRKEEIPEDYSIREIADDTACVMKHLGLEHAYVYGVSQGGMVAQYLAVYYPELIDKLVLGVTASKTNRIMEDNLRRWISLSEQGDAEAIVEDILLNMYSEAYVKRYRMLIPLMKKSVKAADRSRFVILAKSCMTCDIYDDLDKISCPVFVIGAKKDLIVSGEASVEIADKLGCEIYMYDDLGHAAYEEAKDFNQKIYEWLRK